MQGCQLREGWQTQHWGGGGVGVNGRIVSTGPCQAAQRLLRLPAAMVAARAVDVFGGEGCWDPPVHLLPSGSVVAKGLSLCWARHGGARVGRAVSESEARAEPLRNLLLVCVHSCERCLAATAQAGGTAWQSFFARDGAAAAPPLSGDAQDGAAAAAPLPGWSPG